MARWLILIPRILLSLVGMALALAIFAVLGYTIDRKSTRVNSSHT